VEIIGEGVVVVGKLEEGLNPIELPADVEMAGGWGCPWDALE